MADVVRYLDVGFLAGKVGLSDPVLRLFLGLLSAYLFSLLYRAFLYRKSNATIQHIYFTCCGFGIALFCYGWGAMHSLINITSVYLLLQIGGPTTATVVLTFILNFGYLLSAYYYLSTDDYDVNWTTAHCSLCLRLISVAWDYYDGNQDWETLSNDFKTTAIPKAPSLLEMLGHSYFYGGFLVGPLFSIKPYLSFTQGTHMEAKEDDNSCARAGFVRLLAGLFYLAIHNLLGATFSSATILSDSFQERSLAYKLVFVAVWSKGFLYKYVGVWLVAEGSCILTGITYNGKDEKGQLRWDGFKNINIHTYETAWCFQMIVDSFNLNTNKWVFRYFFKRLRFLGNKTVSHFGTLMFLALWHGYYAGYFISFVWEFFVIRAEREVFALCFAISKKPLAEMSAAAQLSVKSFGLVVRLVIFGICSMPFSLLRLHRIHKVLYAIHYIFPGILVVWTLLAPFFIVPLTKRLSRQDKDKDKLKKAE